VLERGLGAETFEKRFVIRKVLFTFACKEVFLHELSQSYLYFHIPYSLLFIATISVFHNVRLEDAPVLMPMVVIKSSSSVETVGR